MEKESGLRKGYHSAYHNSCIGTIKYRSMTICAVAKQKLVLEPRKGRHSAYHNSCIGLYHNSCIGTIKYRSMTICTVAKKN